MTSPPLQGHGVHLMPPQEISRKINYQLSIEFSNSSNCHSSWIMKLWWHQHGNTAQKSLTDSDPDSACRIIQRASVQQYQVFNIIEMKHMDAQDLSTSSNIPKTPALALFWTSSGSCWNCVLSRLWPRISPRDVAVRDYETRSFAPGAFVISHKRELLEEMWNVWYNIVWPLDEGIFGFCTFMIFQRHWIGSMISCEKKIGICIFATICICL